MSYLVFAQSAEPHVDLPRLLANARSYFEVEVEVLGQTESEVRLELRRRAGYREGAGDDFTARFRVRARRATPEDLDAAKTAEARGNAAGMGLLAERCPSVWQIEPEADAPEAATLSLAALLASVALGPVMPPDGSTLMGVRSSMERARKLLGNDSLHR